MTKKFFLPILALMAAALPAGAQGIPARDFKAVNDSLKVLMQKRTSVRTPLRLEKIMKRDGVMDFYFSRELVDYPWKESDVKWVVKERERRRPAAYKSIPLGEIYGNTVPLQDLGMPETGNSGKAVSSRFRTDDKRSSTVPLVTELGREDYPKGLSRRHIALWQSHGRYFEETMDRWEWQRAPTNRTVEDMYTPSYVLPFLIPMLENAGACVLTPRERDTQVNEVVCDNDPSFGGSRTGLLRREGKYSERGGWQDAGIGFADRKETYSGYDNPFRMGTCRMAPTARHGSPSAEIKWTPDIPERGFYAVYVSYKSLTNSTESANYTVTHMGGSTSFAVNQKMGGGMWVYLGTFEFDKGEKGSVVLSNDIPEGRRGESKTYVTADAVRFGGGMGKVERGISDDSMSTSCLPCFTEGAMYSMQWSGIDMRLLDPWNGDYQKDYAGRGAWVTHLSGGSRVNPRITGRKIPFDLSLAFHTDAGVTPNDSIVGTLSIYTGLCDGKDELPDGEKRLSGRALADMVQTQIVGDIRSGFEPAWTRRATWDRSYSESRTTGVPAMLLELLSHQNFADMKYGLDPSFRFTVCRAVYKGILKYLSSRYGCPYAVQPLPVRSFSAELLDDGKARLSWLPTEDKAEPTATAEGYIVQTRTDDGAFDGGTAVKTETGSDGRVSVTVDVPRGHLSSFRIIAFNKGGRSFPSEVLCVGTPSGSSKGTVLIVNNFTRVSAPVWFDTPTYAGFDGRVDGGVPYMEEINFIGEQYQFRRGLPWIDDDNPGFGASYTHQAGKKVAGNTFDFPAVHARALLKAGWSVVSASCEAFSANPHLASGTMAADIICGKQVTTKIGRGAVPNRFMVYPEELQAAVREYTSKGGNILISGANLGTDAWDTVYETDPDTKYQEKARRFTTEVLGFKWMTNYATDTGEVSPATGWGFPQVSFRTGPNPYCYAVETPDGLVPLSEGAYSVMKYSGNGISAGVAYDSGNYRAVSFGFPIEAVSSVEGLESLVSASMKFLSSGGRRTE